MDIIPLILMLLLTFVVIKSIITMLRNHDDVYAFAVFVLYIYTIFAQIGYCYFPELSIMLGAYFGRDVYYEYYFVMLSSFISFYCFYKYFRKRKYTRAVFFNKMNNERKVTRKTFIILYIFLFFILAGYFYTHRGEFAWGQNYSMGPAWFSFIFNFFNKAIFILYVHNRNHFSVFKTVTLSVSILFFLQVSASAGNRSPILYYFFMFVMYEMYPFITTFRLHKKRLIMIGIFVFFVIQGLQLVMQLRTSTNEIGFSELKAASESSSELDVALYEKILLQDYYSPSHPLFVAIEKNYIDPVEVLLSTICNSVYFVHYDHLTNTVLSLIGLKFERNEGWAFHYFIEGFVAAGFLAFLYNGVILNLLMRLLLMFSKTNDQESSRFMLAIITYFITNCMRGQTSIFIRDAIFFLIPILFMYAFSYGWKVRIKKIK